MAIYQSDMNRKWHGPWVRAHNPCDLKTEGKIRLPGPVLSTDFARLSSHLDLVEKITEAFYRGARASGYLPVWVHLTIQFRPRCSSILVRSYICNEFKFNRASSEPMKELPITIDQNGIGPCFDTIRPQQLPDNTKSFTS